MIQGDASALAPTLDSCISEFNRDAQYSVAVTTAVFEVHKEINAIYDFKWVFHMSKLAEKVAKKVIYSFLMMPMVNTVAALDGLIKNVEEQSKKKMQADLRYAYNKDGNIRVGQMSGECMSETMMQIIKDEENKYQKINENKKKEEEAKRNRNLNELKRKQQEEVKVDKRVKVATGDNYKESEAEAKRKKEIAERLNKKKDKKTLDFL
jgi:trehalose/maltose hydrolase-like predicted phosphorylase